MINARRLHSILLLTGMLLAGVLLLTGMLLAGVLLLTGVMRLRGPSLR